MNPLLAAPLRGSKSAVAGREVDVAGRARWRLVERRLLSPARADALECLVRLERADGLKESWRAGDLIELPDPFGAQDIDDAPFRTAFRTSRHAGVGLLAGGWPAEDWVRRAGTSRRLPIASGAGSATLDLLIFAGRDASPALDSETRQRLLLDMTVDLRIISSRLHWAPDDPLIFIGDFGAAALARAFAQEHQGGELIFLIEAGRGDKTLSPQSILRRDCWREGTVRTMPTLGDLATLAAMFEAHRRRIRALVDAGAPLVVAGVSQKFFSIVDAGLADLLGVEAVALLRTQGRLRHIGL